MLWNENISFTGFRKKISDWYKDKESELCNPPIDAQYALDLIFKTLIDDKEKYPYLTSLSETTAALNAAQMLHAATLKQLATADNETKHSEETASDHSSPEKPRKRGFLGLFRRKG